MHWGWWVLIGLLIAVLGFIAWYILSTIKRTKKTYAELQTRSMSSLPAKGTVVKHSLTGFKRKTPQGVMVAVDLTLKVLPQRGSLAYNTNTSWLVQEDKVNEIKVGKEFDVRIDFKEKTIVFPMLTWAGYNMLNHIVANKKGLF